MGITLNIFWKTKEEMDLEKAGVDGDSVITERTPTKPITFYNIDYIHPHEGGFCCVGSGREEFISRESYEEVKFLRESIPYVGFN